jgi:hypothetical protein
MLKKLYTLLTNFPKPFIEALDAWSFIINQDTEDFYTIFFWDQLSYFAPGDPYPVDFFECYSSATPPYSTVEVDLRDDSVESLEDFNSLIDKKLRDNTIESLEDQSRFLETDY